jgi:DNA-directed RNA polymerase subunit beta'
VVKFGDVAKGQRKIYVVADNGTEKEYQVPRGVHINVQEGERIKAGEPLMDGPLNPHDILSVLGEKELQAYLVNEIQEVYRLQGVNISDKHIEVIVRQMMRWRKVEDVGDTQFLLEQQVDKFRFAEENERVIAQGGRPATGRPLLLGITKASLSTDSFISAASFQETTRVLTEAAVQGKIDTLDGLRRGCRTSLPCQPGRRAQSVLDLDAGARACGVANPIHGAIAACQLSSPGHADPFDLLQRIVM